MGAGGVVNLGNSKLNPNLIEFVANGTPGNPGDSFITVGNHGSFPISVCPAFTTGSPDYPTGHIVPALARSTIAIDPERGVILTALSSLTLRRNNLLNIRTFVRRNVTFRLHSYGAAPSEPLYPADSLIAVTTDLTLTGNSGQSYYVGPTGVLNLVPASIQMATGPQDICIMALTAQVQANALASGDLILATCLYDPDNPTQLDSDMMLFGSGDGIGAVSTMLCRGAFGVLVSSSNVAANTISMKLTFWLGVPAL